MYENKRQKLAPKKVFYSRIWKNTWIGIFLIILCLALGAVGYKLTICQFDWYDSFLNAAMILSGMGPVIDSNIVLSNNAKVFAAAYALFSGVAFLSIIGILLAPVVHRFFHKLHLEEE